MTTEDSTEPDPKGEQARSRPLDKLLSKRSKPFRDWKEEREYLRRKWGPQGKRIQPGKPREDDPQKKDA